MKAGLTRRQWDLLGFIQRYSSEHGFSPSMEEMKVEIGLHSKSGIHRMVCALEERGYISRLKNRSRAIFVEGTTFVIPNDLLIALRASAKRAGNNITTSDLIESALRQAFAVPACSNSRDLNQRVSA